MRVTHMEMFNSFLNNMHTASSKLMQLNNQAASQKKINQPSDDPVGTIRVMEYRDSIESLKQFRNNIDTGKGWLKLADDTLMKVNNLLSRAKSIAEQASTGTLTKEQRQSLSYEVEQIFSQVVSLSNTSYEGKSIFSGQKVDENAFESAMNVTSNKNDIQDKDIISITGEKGGTTLVQFQDDGTVDSSGGSNIGYRYSTNGGETWTTVDSTDSGALNSSGNTTLHLGDKQVKLADGYEVEASASPDDTSGTWLWVRPTAKYQGDSENEYELDVNASSISSPEDIHVSGDIPSGTTLRIDNASASPTQYSYSTDGGKTWTSATTDSDEYELPGGNVTIPDSAGSVSDDDLFTINNGVQVEKAAEDSSLNIAAKGDFDSGTVVRIDSVSGSGDVEYSYSTDNGTSWSTGHSTSTSENTYLLPEGRMEVVDGSIQEGDQFYLRPQEAKLDFQISADESLQVNNIGKQVFGGIMGDEQGSVDKTVFGRDSKKNIFETLGKFIGYLDTNNQSGVQESLSNLDSNIKHISNTLASVGARENRLDVADSTMSSLVDNQKNRKSNLEDVDVAEIMTKLQSQRVAYQAVLRSTSQVMQMNLMNYI